MNQINEFNETSNLWYIFQIIIENYRMFQIERIRFTYIYISSLWLLIIPSFLLFDAGNP